MILRLKIVFWDKKATFGEMVHLQNPKVILVRPGLPSKEN